MISPSGSGRLSPKFSSWLSVAPFLAQRPTIAFAISLAIGADLSRAMANAAHPDGRPDTWKGKKGQNLTGEWSEAKASVAAIILKQGADQQHLVRFTSKGRGFYFTRASAGCQVPIV